MTSKKSRKRIVSDSPATHPTPSSGNGFENGWEVPAGKQPAAASGIKQKSILAYFKSTPSQQAAVSIPSTGASNARYTAETGLQIASESGEQPGNPDVNVQVSQTWHVLMHTQVSTEDCVLQWQCKGYYRPSCMCCGSDYRKALAAPACWSLMCVSPTAARVMKRLLVTAQMD